MLGAVADVHDSAFFKMTIADVKVAMVTVDGDAATPELTAIESEVVVIELQESYAPFAVFKQAVFERGLRERMAFVGVLFQNGGIGETSKRQVAVRDLRLKTLGGLIVKSDAGFASTLQFKAYESRIGHSIQDQHRSAADAIPNELRVTAAPDDQSSDPPGSSWIPE